MKIKTHNPAFALLAAIIMVSLLSACGASPTPGAGSTPSGSLLINGAGATFPLPVYTEWAYAYSSVDPSVTINYQGIGSGGGKKGIIDNTIDFAGSDSLLLDDEYTRGIDLQMYPMLAGAVVVIYNFTPTTDYPQGFKAPALIFDRQTLVDIFNGKINKWNDPAIKATNPELVPYLPDAAFTVVHRSDGSGTTEIFTKALSAFSADWTAGGAPSIEWPVDKAGNGIGGKGNAGVAAAIQNTPNSLGYVELSYAVENKLSYASQVNKAGKVVSANSTGVASAISDFAGTFNEKLTATIVDGGGEATWPITGYTYIILHTTSMADCVKAKEIVKFFHWALSDPAAIQIASHLGYSTLPDAVREKVFTKFAEVTCKGQPVMPK
jgi:phosphate transport system substrate-binding protein